ncbi:MAG: hypothetical protein ACOX2U_00095 [Limisphaerales bacterium]|jgi:hypothetical protein|nr:hypothetical protein [Verrucomicrobiota bacterium]
MNYDLKCPAAGATIARFSMATGGAGDVVTKTDPLEIDKMNFYTMQIKLKKSLGSFPVDGEVSL